MAKNILIAAVGLTAMIFPIPGAVAGDQIQLYRYTFDVSRGEPAVPPALRYNDANRGDGGLYKLIHLTEGMNPALRTALLERGVEVLTYIPHNAFVVRTGNEGQLANLAFVDWVGDFHPAYKIHPNIGNQTFASQDRIDLGFVLHITLHPGADLAANRTRIAALGGEILSEMDAYGILRFEARFAKTDVVETLAHLNDVVWIAEKGERGDRNDRVRWILQSYDDPGNVTMATPIYDQGIHGEGQIVGVIDGTMDLDHCLFTDGVAVDPGPTHRKVVYLDGSVAVSSHGTHVAGTVAGRNEDGSLDNAGMAFNAKLAFTRSLGNQSGNLLETLGTHRDHGAFVHSNSWGEVDSSPVATDYTTDCQDIDTFTYNNEDHLVLFASMNDSTFPLGPLLSPENSINVLAVGATEGSNTSENPHLLSDRHGSCRSGPTVLDGRRKPEIFSPGCTTRSSSSNTTCSFHNSCGTSMATPATAGAAALVRQFFVDGFYPSGAANGADSLVPSGALIKAVLLNGTVNMLEETQAGANFSDLPIPNDVEGWGRTNLDHSLAFAGETQQLEIHDIRNANGLSTSGTRTFDVVIDADIEPLRITMVFTAPPASVATGNPVINNLDLRVTAPDESVFLGNVWSGGASVTGGSPDAINNVEQVLIPVPEAGTYQVEVIGTAVNVGSQGFALAITGALRLECDLAIDVSEDATLACWGDTTTLTGVANGGGLSSISWEPADGLSNPTSLTTMATPTQTTTYTLTVMESAACFASAQVTVEVPDMDLDSNQVLDGDDIAAFFEDDIWPGPALGIAANRDYDGNGLIQVSDLIYLVNCMPPKP